MLSPLGRETAVRIDQSGALVSLGTVLGSQFSFEHSKNTTGLSLDGRSLLKMDARQDGM